MGIYSLLLPVVVGLALFQSGHCLVCYDNVANDGDTVLIDCSYYGAKCAVTNKTTTTTTGYYRKRVTSTESKLLYHCAHRSCDSGPMNYCEDEAGSTVNCSTKCCDSDKCNTPTDNYPSVKEVAAKDALSCHQLLGKRAETVECLFEDAQCLSMEIGPQLSHYLSSQEIQATQFCATKKRCNELKPSCDAYRDSSYSILSSTCKFTCCDTDYCNYLSVKYADDDSDDVYYPRNNGNRGYTPGSSRVVLPTRWLVIIGIVVIAVVVSICTGAVRAARKKRPTTTVYTRAAAPNQYPEGTVGAG